MMCRTILFLGIGWSPLPLAVAAWLLRSRDGGRRTIPVTHDKSTKLPFFTTDSHSATQQA